MPSIDDLPKHNPHLDRPATTENTFPAMLRRAAARFTPKTIIDVGASDGQWSCMVREIWPEAALLLFEPNPVYQPALAAMEASGAHVARALACAESSGVKTLRMDFEKPYQGVYELDDSIHAGAAEVVTASVSSIDNETKLRGLPGPFFVKLDTHGREHDILAGARETLKYAVGLVIEVYTWSQGPNSMRAAELVRHIENQHGFLPTDLCEPLRRPYDSRLVQCDMLFEHRTAAGMEVPNLW
jgi:FkbM family methyltransferase